MIKRESKGEQESQLTGNESRNGNWLFDVKLVGGASYKLAHIKLDDSS